MYKFTAIVVCYNEDRHLQDCLVSLASCNEILVYDMGSTDRSPYIAQKYATEVRYIPKVDVVEKIWGKVISEAKNDWVILLDPDELFPTKLYPELQSVITDHPNVSLISIPWKFYFLGKPLNSTIWGRQSYKARVFNRKQIEVSGLVFDGIKITPGYEVYSFPYEQNYLMQHYWIDSIGQLFSKHWRYIKNDGEARYQKGERFSFRKLISNTTRSLRKNLFEYNGLHDGWRGLSLSLFHAWFIMMCHLSLCYYQIIKTLKLYETHSS